MMDNEQPWNPPGPQQIAQIPKITPQVPDVTLYSPENRPLNQKSNFLQRAIANEKVLNNAKQLPFKSNQHPVPSSPTFENLMQITPSVPDLSLINQQPLHQINRISCQTGPVRAHSSSSSNSVFARNDKVSKENVFGVVGRHSVPDVTILDEEPKHERNQKASNDQVFSESYKKMLINSHEKFMKQMKSDNLSPEQVNPAKKKSGLFNPQANKYQENPLRKYAPKPQPVAYENDGNSSSILMEFENIVEPPVSSGADDKTDEMTFKKVAEMLSEIQKLVIPTPTTTDQIDQEVKPDKSLKKHEVLMKLAKSYLSKEELEFYNVEKEIDELKDEIHEDS